MLTTPAQLHIHWFPTRTLLSNPCRGFEWDGLAQRRLKAPYVPKVSGPADASNFDVAQGGQHAKRNSRYISTGVFKDF
jgi:hypothetical protein